MYETYIFDLYGTLVDIRTDERRPSLWRGMANYMTLRGVPCSAASLRRDYRRAVEEARRAVRAAWGGTCPPALAEPDLAAVIAALYAAGGRSADGEEIAHWALTFRALSLDYLRPYPGAAELPDRLRAAGARVFLLSNAQRLFTEPELRALGLWDRFDGVLLSSDVGAAKPSPLFYRALLKRYAIDPANAVMVGNDAVADAWGAHACGLACMYVHTAQSPALTGPLPPGCRVLENIAQAAD